MNEQKIDDTTQPDILRLASSLTAEEWTALEELSEHDWMKVPYGDMTKNLYEKGLIRHHPITLDRILTSLGEQVLATRASDVNVSSNNAFELQSIRNRLVGFAKFPYYEFEAVTASARDFIEHAPSDVNFLLTELQRLRDEVTYLRTLAGRAANIIDGTELWQELADELQKAAKGEK